MKTEQQDQRTHQPLAAQINWRQLDGLSKLGCVLGLGLGSGLLPKAPGTWGSLAILPLVWLSLQLSPLWYIGLLIALLIIGIWCCGVTAKALGVHDDGRIVFDEFAGQYLTFAPMVWWGTDFVAHGTMVWLLIGFVLFRLFDVLKPTPIRQLDARVHGGFGIMLDDVLAGVFAAAALWLLAMWL